MSISSIRLTYPFCDASQEKQTKCSLISRSMAVGLGAIALLIGVLILCNIPSLSTLGTTGGSLFSALGALVLLTGAFLRCIKRSDQQGSEHSTQVSHTGAQGDSQRVSFDFAQITPANYEKYLDVSKRYTEKKGDFVFIKGVHDRDFVSSSTPYECRKGDAYLNGTTQYLDKGLYNHVGVEICNGKFVHYPQKSAPPEHFSNLKDFFDYLFQGDFYQGECTRDMEFFALKTIGGEEVRYYNTFNNGGNKRSTIELAQIIPANYEERIDTNHRFNPASAKVGDFRFTKNKGDSSLIVAVYYGNNILGGAYDYGYLKVCNGEFVHHQKAEQQPNRFSNLKAFLDYFFQGKFITDEKVKELKFITLITTDGQEIRYDNPYKS